MDTSILQHIFLHSHRIGALGRGHASISATEWMGEMGGEVEERKKERKKEGRRGTSGGFAMLRLSFGCFRCS